MKILIPCAIVLFALAGCDLFNSTTDAAEVFAEEVYIEEPLEDKNMYASNELDNSDVYKNNLATPIEQEALELGQIIQLFHAMDAYIREYTGSSIISSPDFQSYSEKIRHLFDENMDLFLEAVDMSGRYGRQAIVASNLRAWGYRFFLLRDALLEDDPSFEYILAVFDETHHLSSVGFMPWDGWGSSLFHLFTRNVEDFLEAMSTYFGKCLEQNLEWGMARYIGSQIALAKDSDHPTFFNEWYSLLEYAADLDLSDGAMLILDAIHDRTNEDLWFHQFWRNAATEELENYKRYGHPPSNQAHQHRLRPAPGWVEDFDWWEVYMLGGINDQIIHNGTRYVATLSVERLLIFNFWRWSDDEYISWMPSCPIWVMSSVHDGIREIMMIDLINHVFELRDGGHEKYQYVIGLLTDPTSVFDPRTQETFEMVNRLLNKN